MSSMLASVPFRRFAASPLRRFAASPLRRSKRRARAFGPPCGLPDLASVIGWGLAHHELRARLGFASSRCCWKRRARAFGPSFRAPKAWPSMAIPACGRPGLLLFAWPKRSRQEKGHPSSAALSASLRRGFARVRGCSWTGPPWPVTNIGRIPAAAPAG